MLANRSIPSSTVIPELPYADVGEAVDWLCNTFGFTLRLGIGNHRAQLNVGDGAVVVTDRGAVGGAQPSGHAVLVRIDNVNRHHERAAQRGATILRPPADHPFGERQYTAQDLGGHAWTFSQSIADVAPETWGGTPGQLDQRPR
jgi:uncharacterized glyoxalase superfamily protein PhnB